MGQVCCCIQVNESTVAIKETCGKFDRVLKPGCHWMPWILGRQVAGNVSLRVQQLDVRSGTKTKDNIFVNVVASVKYRVLAEKASVAFYELTNPKEQIQAYVCDVICSRVPKLNLEEVFEQKNEIAKAVKSELDESMSKYGYEILQSLIIDINPDESVKKAMNELNAAKKKAEAKELAQHHQAMVDRLWGSTVALLSTTDQKEKTEVVMDIIVKGSPKASKLLEEAKKKAEAKELAQHHQAMVDRLWGSTAALLSTKHGEKTKDIMDKILEDPKLS